MRAEDLKEVSLLARGDYNEVYTMHSKKNDSLYAVKVVRRKREDISQAESLELATASYEADILSRLSHPRVIKLEGVHVTPEAHLYVMEHCGGGDLRSILQLKGLIPLEAARYIALEIAQGLHYLHKGKKIRPAHDVSRAQERVCIVHREIKPQNIVFTEDRHVKLVDFGSAIILDRHKRSISTTFSSQEGLNQSSDDEIDGLNKTFAGATLYMSPEMLNNPDTLGPAHDYWSLGVVLYEMLIGSCPFTGAPYDIVFGICDNPVSFPVNMDPMARDLCERLLEKDPKKRLTGSDVQRHPFFSSVGQVPLSRCWIFDTPWEPDSARDDCPECTRPFLRYWRRRHHCRCCGLVVCGECSSQASMIPDSTFQTEVRVCDSCFLILKEV